MAAILNENFIIKTFDKEYGDYLYVADLESCNLCERNDEGIIFTSYDEAMKAKEQLQKNYPEYIFEVDNIFIEEAY